MGKLGYLLRIVPLRLPFEIQNLARSGEVYLNVR